MSSKMMVFTGNSNRDLAKKVASRLYLELGSAKVDKFSDGEVTVELNENVRGKDVFVLQSTCEPTNDNLMELLLIIDALRRASASRITAVVPYFGYARQDRRVRSARVPISSKVVADMMVSVGVDRVLTVDLHAEQIQGFFTCPVGNVYGSPILNDDIVASDFKDVVVVSPDIGGVVRARAIAKQLDDADLASTAAAGLKKTLLMFDAFHDVVEKSKTNTHAMEVLQSWLSVHVSLHVLID